MLRNKKILIVDDEPDIRDILSSSIIELNAQVYEASNAVEAFSLFQKKEIDIVITDMRMPGGDGLQLIKNIREKWSGSQPVIYVCSGFNDLTADHERIYNIKKIFSKPFRLDTITEELLKNK